MTCPDKTAGVLALLAALLIGSPASAGDSDTPRKDLQEQVRELREDLANLKRAYEQDLRANNLALRRIADQLDRLDRSITRLTGPMNGRTSRFFDPMAPTATGTIRLDNRLAVTATVLIDGMEYTVPPLSTTMLRNQPVGTISYAVTAVGYGLGPLTRTPVRANETLTLTIRP
jgi:hypothetical protein